MLTRQAIHSGAYLEHFESMPNLLTREQIEASLAETMKARPADAPEIWVFAYGSLMWNPMVEFDTRCVATLHGWHRSFCLRMVVGRGSHEKPGRMLALEPGGQTSGLAFRLSHATLGEELRLIWIREMVLGSYRPTWARITLGDGTSTHAIAFVADAGREQFEADSSVATVAPLIDSASGRFGSNAEYLLELRATLAACGLQDAYIAELADALERLSPQTSNDASGVRHEAR